MATSELYTPSPFSRAYSRRTQPFDPNDHSNTGKGKNWDLVPRGERRAIHELPRAALPSPALPSPILPPLVNNAEDVAWGKETAIETRDMQHERGLVLANGHVQGHEQVTPASILQTIAAADGVWGPSHDRDLTFHLELDSHDDFDDDLEEISRLSRLGKFGAAMKVFQSNLQPHLDNPCVLVHYAEMLLEQGNYRSILDLDSEPIYEAEKAMPNHEGSRVLRMYWELMQLFAKSLDTLPADAEFTILFDTFDLLHHAVSLGVMAVSSTEVRMLSLIARWVPRGSVGVEYRWLYYTLRRQFPPSFYASLYSILLRQGRIWDVHDLMVTLFCTHTIQDALGCLFDTLDTRQGLCRLMADWETSNYDESTTFALLGILNSMALNNIHFTEGLYFEETHLKTVQTTIDICLAESLPLVRSIVQYDPENMMSRQYIRSILARAIWAEQWSVDGLGSFRRHLDSADGLVYQPNRIGLPIYIPLQLENPGWKAKDSDAEFKDPVKLVLKASRELDDFDTAVMGLQQLIRLSSCPKKQFKDLCDLQKAVQGDTMGYLESLLSGYLVSDTDGAVAELKADLVEHKSQGSPVLMWLGNMMLRGLEQEFGEAEGLREEADQHYDALPPGLKKEVEKQMPSLLPHQRQSRKTHGYAPVVPSYLSETQLDDEQDQLDAEQLLLNARRRELDTHTYPAGTETPALDPIIIKEPNDAALEGEQSPIPNVIHAERRSAPRKVAHTKQQSQPSSPANVLYVEEPESYDEEPLADAARHYDRFIVPRNLVKKERPNAGRYRKESRRTLSRVGSESSPEAPLPSQRHGFPERYQDSSFERIREHSADREGERVLKSPKMPLAGQPRYRDIEKSPSPLATQIKPRTAERRRDQLPTPIIERGHDTSGTDRQSGREPILPPVPMLDDMKEEGAARSPRAGKSVRSFSGAADKAGDTRMIERLRRRQKLDAHPKSDALREELAPSYQWKLQVQKARKLLDVLEDKLAKAAKVGDQSRIALIRNVIEDQKAYITSMSSAIFAEEASMSSAVVKYGTAHDDVGRTAPRKNSGGGSRLKRNRDLGRRKVAWSRSTSYSDEAEADDSGTDNGAHQETNSRKQEDRSVPESATSSLRLHDIQGRVIARGMEESAEQDYTSTRPSGAPRSQPGIKGISEGVEASSRQKEDRPTRNTLEPAEIHRDTPTVVEAVEQHSEVKDDEKAGLSNALRTIYSHSGEGGVGEHQNAKARDNSIEPISRKSTIPTVEDAVDVEAPARQEKTPHGLADYF